jgi:hypothetical protein
LIWTREEDIQHDVYRPVATTRIKAGLDASGNLIAWQQRIVSPSVFGTNPGLAPPQKVDPTSVEGSADKRYTIPNFLVDLIVIEVVLGDAAFGDVDRAEEPRCQAKIHAALHLRDDGIGIHDGAAIDHDRYAMDA